MLPSPVRIKFPGVTMMLPEFGVPARLAGEMGFAGLMVPEAHGGAVTWARENGKTRFRISLPMSHS